MAPHTLHSVLDNPVLSSLGGAHRRFALTEGRAARYPASVSPFMALPDDPTADDWRALGRLAGGDAVGLVDPPEPPRGWSEQVAFPVLQMIGSAAMPVSRTERTDDVLLEQLDSADAPAMLALARRTRPGPFEERTHELGGFFGAWHDGRLVAMAGERLRPDGHTEVSAVCTDESHRGRGLGQALMERVILGILERGETPFLHVVVENVGAIRLYERLGFTERRRFRIAVLQPGS
jgi:ribosomal protein S18 acetylase RimI-like enzyme